MTFQPSYEKVLEIGCGNGFLLETALDQGWKNVIGVEPSIEHSKFSVKAGNRIYRDFNEIDIKFDNIIHFYVLEHVNDPKDFLIKCLNF